MSDFLCIEIIEEGLEIILIRVVQTRKSFVKVLRKCFIRESVARLDFRIRGNERIVNGSSRCSQFPPEVVGGISSSYRDVAVFGVAIARQKQRNNFYCTWDTIALYCDVRRIE